MLLLRTPLIRRAGVIALAVILSGLALAQQRTPLQTVIVSKANQSRTFLLAADSFELDQLRTQLTRQAIAKRTPKPDAYYEAEWRMQAAAHYLALAESRAETARRATAQQASGLGTIRQAAFREAVEVEETTAIDHWREQHAAARLAFETLAAGLPAEASADGVPATLQLGPVIASAAKPAELLVLLALAGLVAGGYLLALQPQQGKIILHTRQQIVVPAGWLVQVQDRRARCATWIYQLACGVCVLAGLLWWL